MPRCPFCNGWLPLWPALLGDVTCPKCNRRLEPKRWTMILALIAGFVAMALVEHWLRGNNSVWVFVADVGAYVLAAVGVYFLLARYREKPPPLTFFPRL